MTLMASAPRAQRQRFGLGCWVRFSMKYHEISLSLLHHSALTHMTCMTWFVWILRFFRSSDSFLPWPNPSAEHPSRSPHSRDLPWGWFVRFPAMRNVQCKAVELQTFCLFLQNSSQCSSHKVTKSQSLEATTLNLDRIADQSSNPWQFTESSYKWTKIVAFKRLQTKPGATWSPAQKWFFLRLTKLTKWQNVTKNNTNKLHNSKGRSLASQSGHTPRCGLYTEDLSEKDSHQGWHDRADRDAKRIKISSLDEERLTWSHTRVWSSRIQPFVIFCGLTAADGHGGLSFWVCGKLSLLMLQTPETVFG